MTIFPFSSTPTRAARLIVVALALMLAVAAFAATTAHAAGIVVNDAGDTTGACATTGTGTCTLRDAITFANSNAGADTITFNIPSGGACSSANTCTITLGSTLPDIAGDVTIDGAPNNGHITVSGSSSYPILYVDGSLTVNALTLANGSSSVGGGAIEVEFGRTLNVTNSTFSGNRATSNSAGGAIENAGTANVTNSTFYNNSTTSSGNGGAIFNQGTLNVTNSTFSGNNAGGSGDGIYTTGVSATTTLKNTLLANSANGANCAVFSSGTLTADDYNIADDNTCDNASQFTSGAIALGALAGNGGHTQTMAIDATSAAFNYGDNTVCAAAPVNHLDQRGETRPQGAYCDTGAYEFVYSGWQTGPNFVVNSAADTDDGSCDLLGQGIGNKDCTLGEAIIAANGHSGADTITFDIPSGGACSSANTCTITLSATLPKIVDALTIDGASNNGRITVDGNHQYRVMLVDLVGGTVTIDSLTIANGSSTTGADSGGGIRNNGSGTLNVLNSTFIGNSTTNGGGGIYNSAWLSVTNSTFSGNSAATGGGISNSGTMIVTNSTISGNSASAQGDGIESPGTVTLKNTLLANSANGSNCEVFFGTFTADAYNIADDATCDNATQVATFQIALFALADNGGPTYTMAIDNDSAAFNTGDNTVCAAAPVNNLDQRGETRPQGLFCDVGAYEYIYTGFQTGPNFVVNSSADTDDGSCDLLGQGVGNQDCTLREAIATANALSGADTITFDIPGTDSGCTAANTCTITLSDNLPHMTGETTIDGAPNNGRITVDGVNAHQIFWADDNFTLNALTVTNGTAFLSSGGVFNTGALSLIANSTFVHNSGASGGHVKNGGAGLLTIVNSTFFDPVNATAIGNTGGGTLVIANSTIDGNNVGGSNGISNLSGATALYNTIVSNNAGVDCSVGSGLLNADAFNLDNDGTCGNATSKTVAEINLQALANNGGHTSTMALGAGSAAVNTGDNGVCAGTLVNNLDQRGITRPQGPTCDVGAYELACPAFPVSVANEGELNFAIGCYNAQTTAGTYTINVTQDIDLTASTTAINNATSGVELLVEGGSHTVDAQSVLDAWAFFIKANTKVTIREITVTGGNTTGPNNTGAVISVVKGTLTLIDSTLTGNQGSFGGALSNATGTVTIENSTLSNNNASGGFLPLGGAIFNAGSDVGGVTTVGTVNVINSTISGNQTSGRGGGIYNSPDGVLNVTNSTISDNQATVGGGGIVNSTDSTITLNNAIVANSTGGDCVLDAGTINAQNSLIEDGLACVNGANSNNLTGDPNLGLLQNNGGPTETHALLPGSIAINAGANALAVDPDNNPLTTDQRGTGYPRIVGGAVDMGAYEKDTPQAVTLASFEAAAQADHVLVTWETVSELENAGFNLYRTATADPPAAADLLAFVPSQGPGSTQGFFYSHEDYDVTAGQAYWYWLEDVDLNGATTLHGPLSVVFTAPTAVTLSGLAASSAAPLAWPWWLAVMAAALAAAAAVVWRRRTTS